MVIRATPKVSLSQGPSQRAARPTGPSMGNTPSQSAQTRLRKPAEQIAKPARKTGRATPSVFFQDSSPTNLRKYRPSSR